MSDVFKITKHIKEWEDNQNLYKRISGELTDEAINWYQNRTIAQIWESCILTWNKNHFKSCKSVTELETCFLERGIDNLKRELFGCLYITMSNLRYMVQVFSENRTTGEICDYEAEEKHFLKMNAEDIVDFIVEFDSYVPRIIETVNHAILKVQQERYIDRIAEETLPAIMDSFTLNTTLRYNILDIKQGNVKLVLCPVGNHKFHMKISMPFEQVRDKMGIIIPAFETIVKQVDDNQTQLEIFSYSYY
jgi:hypothetical protein